MYGPPYETVCEKYARADAVVVATVASVRSGGNGQFVRLNLEKTFKGSLKGAVELDQILSSCDWDFSNTTGQRLLLYLAKNNGQKSYHAIGTGYGGEVDREQADIYWLSALPRSLKRTRISGSLGLYESQPFRFVEPVANTPVRVSSSRKSFDVVSDKSGVFEIWDVPAGKYKITPSFSDLFSLRFSLSFGNIEFKRISSVEVDTEDFDVVIGPDKCGGADYVLNRRNQNPE